MDKRIAPEYLRLIYDETRDIIFLLEVLGPDDYRVLSVNQQYLNSTGQADEALVGRRISDIFSDEELAYLLKRYGEAIQGGKFSRYETETRLNQSSMYIETMLVPVFDDNNRCTHLIGVSRDISARVQERQRLKAEKKRAETYLEISEALIIGLDEDCTLTMMNRKGYEVLGYPEGSVIGRNWCDLAIRPERREEYMTGFKQFVKEGMTREHVNYLITAEGEPLLVRSVSTFVRDHKGNVTGILSSGVDITDRKRAEQAMIASQRSLAAEEVVTAVAHDFNNSLQGIMGNIEIALGSADLPEAVKRPLLAASHLADDAAGRIESLRHSAERTSSSQTEVINVADLIDEVIEESRHLWKDLPERTGRRISLNVAASEKGSAISGHRNELRSVLYNVIKNAAEAITDDGTITVATLRRGHPPDGEILIHVSDTGCGMDEKIRARVFQAFYSTKGLEAGRGLGLAASHSILRSHGGEIEVLESEPGRGTTFEIRLPMAQTDSEPASTPSAGEPHDHHVLWVDDDPAVRSIAEGFLKLLKVGGDVVDSAPAALNRLADQSYTLVITDIGMQGMSGIELANEIRTTNPDIPIVAVTGWGDSVLDNEGAGAVSGLLGKPIRLNDLKSLLSEYSPAS